MTTLQHSLQHVKQAAETWAEGFYQDGHSRPPYPSARLDSEVIKPQGKSLLFIFKSLICLIVQKTWARAFQKNKSTFVAASNIFQAPWCSKWMKKAGLIQQKHDFKSYSSLSIFLLPLSHPLSPSLSLPLFLYLYLPFSFSSPSAVALHLNEPYLF